MGWERAKNCFPVPNELLQLNLPAGAVAVYIYLLCHADRRTNRCHPSEATMAKVLHLSRNTVAKHVRLLEEYGLIITERTQVQMKNGIRKNGNLRYTIVPMYDVLEQRYQRQMAELERQQVQQKLAAQVAEAPCSPLRAAVQPPSGWGSVPSPGEGFRASFGRIFVDFPGSAEDEGRGRIKGWRRYRRPAPTHLSAVRTVYGGFQRSRKWRLLDKVLLRLAS